MSTEIRIQSRNSSSFVTFLYDDSRLLAYVGYGVREGVWRSSCKEKWERLSPFPLTPTLDYCQPVIQL